MRLTRLIALGLLGLTTASVINPQARFTSVTLPNNTTTNFTASLQPTTLPSDSPVISHSSPLSPAAVFNAVDGDIDMSDFDEEDENENTQHHGGHGGGHGGHGRGHSRGASGHGSASGGADGGRGGGGAAVGAGGSANAKKSDGGRLRIEVLGLVVVAMMGMGVVLG